MKKPLCLCAILLSVALLFCAAPICFAEPALTEVAYEDGAEYIAYANGAPNWAPVYVPNDGTQYTVENVKECQWNADYTATIPEDDSPAYERIYVNEGDPTRFVSGSDLYDLGLAFTAPAESAYRLDFTGYANMEGSDGMIVRVYDNGMALRKELAVTADEKTFSEIFTLQAGEKIYVFFNKGGHNYSDSTVIKTLKTTMLALPLSEAVFTPADTEGIKVSVGASYPQFFNVQGNPDIFALWTGFYVSDNNSIEYLVADNSNGPILKLPEALRVGNDQWMQLWEGLNNATSPMDRTIGDYFTAPAKGTVTVSATFQYLSDPGDNPAAADGIGVTVYKNRIAQDAIVIERTLFDWAGSGESGKSISKEGVEVEVGDMLIFVYDSNETVYSDNMKPIAKAVTYTAVDHPADIFRIADATKAKAEGNTITAVKGQTLQDLTSILGADAANLAVYDSNGSQILTTSSTQVEDGQMIIFFNDTATTAPIGAYTVVTVDSLAEEPGNGTTDSGDSSGSGNTPSGSGEQASNQQNGTSEESPDTGDLSFFVMLAILAGMVVTLLVMSLTAPRKKYNR